MLYVRQLPKNDLFRLYKYIKGFILYDKAGKLGTDFCFTMSAILDEKAKDINIDDLAWDICEPGYLVNFEEVYRDYSYGRYSN